MLTIKSTARQGLGKLTVHFVNGDKTTLTAWCPRSEIETIKRGFKDINGNDCSYHKIYWNGKILN